MKRMFYVILSAFLIMLMSFPIAAAQQKKSVQRIKIVVSDTDSANVLLDTLITGSSKSDSIILKNGRTIYLTKSEGDDLNGRKDAGSYVITTTTTGDEGCKHTSCESLASGNKYTYKIVSDENRETNSEETKYVISRDGLRITVEGSDYDKVRKFTKEIEKTLDSKKQTP